MSYRIVGDLKVKAIDLPIRVSDRDESDEWPGNLHLARGLTAGCEKRGNAIAIPIVVMNLSLNADEFEIHGR